MSIRVTIKDIAKNCNVSTAVASAALRNKKGTVAYSSKTQELVWKAAKKLNYHPNRIAQAMRTGTVPLIALCLHIEKEYEYEVNWYLHDLLPNMAYSLQKNGLEMIFFPYGDFNEFKERSSLLIRDNLISGIVTNFPPAYVNEMAGYLKKITIPFVMLGPVADDTVPYDNIDYSELTRQLLEYGENIGFKNVVQVLVRKNISGQTDWENKSGKEELDFSKPDTLWVALGENVRRALIEEKAILPKNIISVENKRVMIHTKPSVYVREKSASRAENVVKMLIEWRNTGIMPSPRTTKLTPEDIEFIL